MANEHPQHRNLPFILFAADLLIFAALVLVALRQTEQGRQQAEERRLTREARALQIQALEAAPRYSGLTVELELVNGDEVRRATVEVQKGESPASWSQTLLEAARVLQETR